MALPNQLESNMNGNSVVSAIVAMSLVTGSLAFAQDRGDSHDRGRSKQAPGQQDRRDNKGRQPDQRQVQGRANTDQRLEERGAGPNYAFHKGDRLPAEYHNRNYVVDDWRSHHLSAPPRGYHWVQVGADYVLVAIATGLILQLLLNH